MPRFSDALDLRRDEPDRAGSFIRQATPALIAFWRIVSQHRYWVLGPAVAAMLLGWGASQLMRPIYQATTTLLIETARSNIVSIKEVYPGLSADREQIRTQTQFLRSREVGLRVVRELRLVAHPHFARALRAKGPAAPGEPGGPATATAAKGRTGATTATDGSPERNVSTDPAEEAVLDALMQSLAIEPIRQSQLVMVKFESPDPMLAARIANRFAEAFIQAEMDMRLQMTIGATAWLADRVQELKQKLDLSERVLADSRERANLLDQKGGSLGAAGQQLNELQEKLVDARVKRAQAQQLFNQVKPGVPGRESATAVVTSASVVRARDVLADAQARLSAAAGRYGSLHPAFKAAELEVQAARGALKQQIENVISSISKDYEVALATERAVQDAVDQNRSLAQRDNRREAEIAPLEQDVISNRQIYQTFLSRLKETSASADVQTPTARIIDAAVAPGLPIKPRQAMIAAGFGLLGLLMGLGLAVVRNQTDAAIRSIEEVEGVLGQPVITSLPVLSRKQLRHRGRLVVLEPEAFFSEMMRMAAASVHFSLLDGSVRSIAVTSAIASEGKSTVATNLALALSRTNRVLLIDADLYRPNVNRLLGFEDNDVGLIQVLLGDVEAGDAIRSVPGSRLQVMLSGKGKGNAFNIATPGHVRQLVQMFEDRFDIVIVDAPPLEVVSDGMMISGACGRTILVTRAGSTPISLVQKTLKRLRRIRAQVLGIIVNAHDFESAERYYGEESGYKSYALYAKGAERAPLKPEPAG